MTRKARLNPYRAKIHYSYSVAEAAKLLGVHRNTVRSWIKAGLPIFVCGREQLMLGSELRSWLKERQGARRTTTPPGQIFCFKCREPRAPAEGMVDVINPSDRTPNVRALCAECGGLMHRRVSLARLEQSGFADQVRAARLAPSREPSSLRGL